MLRKLPVIPTFGRRVLTRCLSTKTNGPPKKDLFEGEVAQIYDNIFEQNAPVWNAIVTEVQNHTKNKSIDANVLDLASGPGEPACMLADVFKSGRILCTDVSPDMLEKSKLRAEKKGLQNITFDIVDMENMSQIESNSLDVVTICYGLMFVNDLDKALQETKRVLKKDGVLVASVWENLQIMAIIDHVMTKVLGFKPPPPPINPNSLSDKSILTDALTKVGFSETSVKTGKYTFLTPENPDLAWKMATLPVQVKLSELQEEGNHGDVIAKARTAFEELTENYEKVNGRLIIPPSTYRLVVAKPI